MPNIKSLKVLAVVPSPACFGLQNLTLSLFGSTPKWVRPHFLTTRWSDGEFDRRLDALKIPHSSAWMGMFSRKLDRDNLAMTLYCLMRLPGAWREFLRLYISFRPDVLYFANHHEVLFFFPLLIWLRRKVVCHIHDPPPAIPFQRASFFIWRRAVGRFLFISQSVRERTEKLGHLRPNDRVVYNGVSLNSLSFPRRRTDRFVERFGWPADSIVFGITGQIIADKGHEEFIEAADGARKANPKIKFVIGGRGAEKHVQHLRELVAIRCLDAYVCFSGWLSSATEFYEGIDVLVLASRHNEGFGLVIAEAAERGVPTVGTRSGGAIEVVIDRETGLLIDKSDAQGLQKAMIKIGSDESLRQRLGQQARTRVAEEFDLAAQARKFADLLCESTFGHSPVDK